MSNMVVNTNILALNSHRNLKGVGVNQSKASARLSSGLKINSAADDAAGLAISEKMRAQIRGLDMASKNSQDAISLVQTAEGGMQEIDNMLQRIRELTVQVSNDTNEHNAVGTGDRQKMQDEVDQLVSEIDSMSERVEFNKKKVINGDYSNASSDVSRIKGEMSIANAALAKNAKLYADATTSETIATAATKSSEDAYVNYTTTTGDYAVAGTAYDGRTIAAGSIAGAVVTSPAPTASATAGATAVGKLGDLLKVAADAAKAVSVSALTNLATKTDGTVDKDFSDFLLNVAGGANTTNVFKGLAIDQTGGAGFKGSAVATSAQVLGVSETALATSDATLATLRQVASYTDAGNRTLSADVQAYVDLAKTAVKAYDAVVASKAEGGEYNTAKKTFETYQNREETLRDTFSTNFVDQGVATANKSSAKANKDAAQSDIAGLTKQLTAAEAAAKASGKNEGLHFQVGANTGQSLQMNIGSAKSDTLGIGDGKGKTNIDFLKDSGVDTTEILDRLDTALSYITTERSKLGASQNRLEYTIKSLDISSENLSASESRIRDTDMAKEMMNKTKADVLSQAATAMLAKGNQAPQAVLQLLQ